MTSNMDSNTIRVMLKCLQINLQRSNKATANVIEFINRNKIDLIFIQEPVCCNNKIIGFPNSLRIYQYGENRKRAAIIINNKNIDAILISNLSNEDVITIEIIYNKLHFTGVSMYLDRTRNIKDDFKILDNILDNRISKGLLCMDSNSRSKAWYDVITNTRGNDLDYYFSSKKLLVMNENTTIPTFQTSRAESKIDLTVATYSMTPHITKLVRQFAGQSF